jgi:hypothetical protein
MTNRIVFDGELEPGMFPDSDIVFVSGADCNYRSMSRQNIGDVVVFDDSDASDHHNDKPISVDPHEMQIIINHDEETEKNVNDFNAMLRRESDDRERRRNSGLNAAALATLVASLSVSSHRGHEPYRWRQKSIYKPTEPDHEAHLSAAEIKRKRKSEKLRKIADRTQGKGA